MVVNLSKILQQKADVLQSLRDRTKVAIGSTPGAGKSVWTKDLNNTRNEAQLKRLVEGAEELLAQARMHEGHLRAKILHVSKL